VRTGLDGGATPRSRVIYGAVAERAEPHGSVQEVSRFAPCRSGSVRRLWAAQLVCGRTCPAIVRPQRTGDVAAFGLEHPGAKEGWKRGLRTARPSMTTARGQRPRRRGAAAVGGYFVGSKRAREGEERSVMARLRSGLAGNFDARKATNLRTGCRVQQTCERLVGENRRSGEEPHGRNMTEGSWATDC
jgi:hypothetical protein